MNKRRLQRTAALLVFVLLGIMFSGCSGKSENNTGEMSGDTDQNTGNVATDGETREELTIYTGHTNYTYFIDALHEKYPEINIKLLSYKGSNTSGFMKYQLENGDIPDIYTTNYLQDSELQEKYLLDLSSYNFINNYSDTMLNSVDVDGGIYLLPSRYQICGINYNKTMFEKYGWTVPESFEELCTLVAEINEEAPGVTPVAARMNLKGYAFQYLWALGNTEFTGTPTGTQWKADFLNGETTAVGNLDSTAEYLEKWIEAGYITDDYIEDDDIMADFYDGKIAMVLGIGTSKWKGTGRTTGETIDVGIMAWPGENGNHGMLISNVSSYYGLNRELAEPGNEQKFEDALKVIEFMSTEEGQQALALGSRNVEAFPFKNFSIDEDSPLYEVKDYIEDGYVTPLVYEGWVDSLLAPMADEIINLIQGTIDTDEMLRRFDEINEEVRANPDSNDYAELDEALDKEQTARLCGMALMDYTGADVSLVSLGGITDDGNNLENGTGVQCGLYPGGIDEEIVNIIRPVSNKIVTVEMSGAEIKAMYDVGREITVDPDELDSEYTYLEQAVTYSMPYELVVRDDAELEDKLTYKVVFAGDDYSDSFAEEWKGKINVLEEGSPFEAIVSWLQMLPDGHFDSSALEW